MKKIYLALLCICLAKGMFSQEVEKIKIADLEKIIEESKKPLIISFWTTWCPPCMEQLSHLLPEVEKHNADSLQVLLVSLDFSRDTAKIPEFLKKKKISVHVVWLDEIDQDYYCPKVDPKWSSAFPATLMINNKKRYRYFTEEILRNEVLEKQIASLLH